MIITNFIITKVYILFLNSLVPKLHILDFCMVNGRESIKMYQFGITRVRSYVLLITVISFYSRTLEKFLQGVEMG